MSRKREAKREAKRELARQLGAQGAQLSEREREELRANARVTTPALRASFEVQQAKRGFLVRKRPLVVHAALYVVDAAGARLARHARFTGMIDVVPGPVALTPSARPPDEPVRYTRPGHFVLLALIAEGLPAEEDARLGAALAIADDVTVGFDGKLCALTDKELARVEAARALVVALANGPALADEDATFLAWSGVSIPAVHRVHSAVRLPIESKGGRLQGTLVLDARL